MSTWTIDASHSSITFSVRHLMISNVKGEFQKVSGTVTWDKANPGASSVEVEIDMNSINTREDKRDAHLKSADFFDTEKFPTMTFRATSVKAKDDGAELTGVLDDVSFAFVLLGVEDLVLHAVLLGEHA